MSDALKAVAETSERNFDALKQYVSSDNGLPMRSIATVDGVGYNCYHVTGIADGATGEVLAYGDTRSFPDRETERFTLRIGMAVDTGKEKILNIRSDDSDSLSVAVLQSLSGVQALWNAQEKPRPFAEAAQAYKALAAAASIEQPRHNIMNRIKNLLWS